MPQCDDRAAGSSTGRRRMAQALLMALLLRASVSCPTAVAADAPTFAIDDRGQVFEIVTGPYRWQVAKTVFNVVQSATAYDQPRLEPGRVTVNFLGSSSTFGAPTEASKGTDWVELRGWADRAKNLWYVARYRFFADQPFCRLVLTLSDRHDTRASDGPWAPYWANRWLKGWRLEIGAPGGRPVVITQRNSYSGAVDAAPWVEVIGASGSPYQWVKAPPPLAASRFQLIHGSGDGANEVIWHPRFEGRAILTMLYHGPTHQYKAGKAVTYEIVDATGKITAKVVDQIGRAHV